MNDLSRHCKNISQEGFSIVNNVYSNDEINKLKSLLEINVDAKPTFRKSAELYAVRQFLKEFPLTKEILFNNNLVEIINQLFGKQYFIVKSIYFDKPETSNWFVSYHQDLTISVDKKIEIKDFGPWTVKSDQFAVQPPIRYLRNIYTIRIHLDDTNGENGALRVIPRSHSNGIFRADTIDWKEEKETECEVKQGGIMIMKPLLMHGSSRTTNNKRRRVIHLEFSDLELPEGLNWAEKENLTDVRISFDGHIEQ
jgi:ectoine hydroxylase-related dioxygenase (phytanoyl-CoA dioxygenase family)